MNQQKLLEATNCKVSIPQASVDSKSVALLTVDEEKCKELGKREKKVEIEEGQGTKRLL